MELHGFTRPVCGSGLIIALLLSAGCGPSAKPKPMTPAEQNLSKFFRLYTAYRSSLKGRPNADVEELKKWAQQQPKEKLAEMGIEDLDKVFISPRDNEPYVLVNLPMGMGPMAAHEKTGSGGSRLVANTSGEVFEANAKRF